MFHLVNPLGAYNFSVSGLGSHVSFSSRAVGLEPVGAYANEEGSHVVETLSRKSMWVEKSLLYVI